MLAGAAVAADTPAIAPSSIYYDLWTIVQPIVVLLVSTVGPVLAAWIGARVISLLKITDQKQQLDMEIALRDALHKSAANALKYALTKTGGMGIGDELTQGVLREAANYVKEKNPDAIAKLGVSENALMEIITSKAADIGK